MDSSGVQATGILNQSFSEANRDGNACTIEVVLDHKGITVSQNMFQQVIRELRSPDFLGFIHPFVRISLQSEGV